MVLFTLYLKEDVDENGNIKPGVEDEANKPFELRKEVEVKKHGKAKGGSWWWGGGDGAADGDEGEDEDDSDEKVAEKRKEENGKAVEATNSDDDVD